MDFSLATRFTSASQQARVMTESWVGRNMYCVNCNAERLHPAPTNAQVVDFTCAECASSFQVKSQSFPIGKRVTDSGYDAMCRAIRSNRLPNLILLHYDRPSWCVRDAMLVPSFGFSFAAVEKRKPLAPTARRAGWVGCNILLSNIPSDLRLQIVSKSEIANSALVRRQYRAMSALRSLNVVSRGWLIDVLNVARSLGRETFELCELYALDDHLASLHPNNLHVRPKIRQQLQKLRDIGLIEFEGKGTYRLVPR
jgi:type II restriction enzyme